jgi:hypothetical protein
MSDSYEVGYGKPPKDTQFKKGSSGNPKGRPKKALDFDHELLRESRSTVVINENGKRRRVSKHELAIKQLLNKAIGGNVPALRTYLDRHELASEKIALLEASQARDITWRDPEHLTLDELNELVLQVRTQLQEGKKSDISNAD